MPEPSARSSPVHDLLDHLHPRWGAVDGMPVALGFGGRTIAQEQGVARTLGLCDVSALPRLVIKGPGAESFLRSHEVAHDLPADVCRVLPWRSGGVIARTGRAEFFLEDVPRDGGPPDVVERLTESLLTSPPPGVYPALRQDASFLLSGDRAPALFLQTCGYDFRQIDARPNPGPDPTMLLVMTRVAGVSTWVLPRAINDHSAYQLWVDGTYGPYLWEILLKLARELGGDAVGLSVFFPKV
jgi:sarcosine oxidase subunit gamma